MTGEAGSFRTLQARQRVDSGLSWSSRSGPALASAAAACRREVGGIGIAWVTPKREVKQA